MKRFVIVTLLLATPALAQNWKTTSEAKGNLKSFGERYFKEFCATCHGPNGEGNGPQAKGLTPPPSNLREIARRRGGIFPTAEIEKTIDGRELVSAHGSREMPVWGRVFSDKVGGGSLGEELNGGYVAALVEYLKGMQR